MKTKNEKNETYGKVGLPPVQENNMDETALVLFGENVTMLPQQLEEMGLAGKVTAREIPGVAPSWKPVNNGDFLLGRCVDMREGLGRFKSTAMIFDTAVPGGFRTVWLGADLKIKLKNAVGRVYSIEYNGTLDLGRPGQQPVKQYRVCEVLPVGAEIPDSIGGPSDH